MFYNNDTSLMSSIFQRITEKYVTVRPMHNRPYTYRKGIKMTIRFTTVEGLYKILEVTEVEIDPISNADMQSINGQRLIVKERTDNGRKG